MFKKLLIANRGEIACRIAATASKLGICTVAVYSDADRSARHVACCNEAIRIGSAPATESYLCVDRIIRAAQRTGAKAIHPGYGFLAENEAFAKACAEAELTFVGPPLSAIRAMGNKSAAKELAGKAGVPLVPGYHGKNQPDLEKQANALGYPVLLKASAGGGGKGIRVIERPEDFAAALAACRREAKNSFGDETLLLEKYLQHPRHIEIQVFADQHGNYVHLFERDCSIQRRYQKVIEEAPAPGLEPELRRLLGETALTMARAVGYIGAGTVEFLVDQDGQFYFLEMNTRLQVEHPVTEMITGQDLVEWQFRIATGLTLPLRQDELTIRGHSIEARIYAENPDNHFLPSTGTLAVLRLPKAVEFKIGSGPEPAAIRLDSGVSEGDAITPYYDPLIAKLIVWGEDRSHAVARLRQALADFIALGLNTNRTFLCNLVDTAEFSTAKFDTGLVDRRLNQLLRPDPPVRFPFLALATAALLERERNGTKGEPGDPFSPWTQTSGWRPNSEYKRTLLWKTAGQSIEAQLTYGRNGYRLQTDTNSAFLSILEHPDHQVVILADGDQVRGQVYIDKDRFDVVTGGEQVTLRWIDPLGSASRPEREAGDMSAPMPGKIIDVLVTNGQTVTKGTPLIIMEAMKMEHTVVAIEDGRVEQVLFNVGDQVSEGSLLVRFSSTSP
jgi:3-methylcrotonyl-CoA carboxylase alpha subunit